MFAFDDHHPVKSRIPFLVHLLVPALLAGSVGCADSGDEFEPQNFQSLQLAAPVLVKDENVEALVDAIGTRTLRIAFDGNRFDLADSNLEEQLGFGSAPNGGVSTAVFDELEEILLHLANTLSASGSSSSGTSGQGQNCTLLTEPVDLDESLQNGASDDEEDLLAVTEPVGLDESLQSGASDDEEDLLAVTEPVGLDESLQNGQSKDPVDVLLDFIDTLPDKKSAMQQQLEVAFGSGGAVEQLLNEALISVLTAQYPEGSEDECDGLKLDEIDEIVFTVEPGEVEFSEEGVRFTLHITDPRVEIPQARLKGSVFWCDVITLDDVTLRFPDAQIDIAFDVAFSTGYKTFEMPWPNECIGDWFQLTYYPDGFPEEYYDIERELDYSRIIVEKTVTADMGEPEFDGVADDVGEYLLMSLFTGLVNTLWCAMIPTAWSDSFDSGSMSLSETLAQVDLVQDDWAIQDLRFYDSGGWRMGFSYVWDGEWDDDGILVGLDNCPDDSNPDQEDGDWDGVGDVCDPEWSLPEETSVISPVAVQAYCDGMGEGTVVVTREPDFMDPDVVQASLLAAQEMFQEMRAQVENLGFEWEWIVVCDDPAGTPSFLALDEVIDTVGKDWISPELWDRLNGLGYLDEMFVSFRQGETGRVVPDIDLAVEASEGGMLTSDVLVTSLQMSASMSTGAPDQVVEPTTQSMTDGAEIALDQP